MAGDAVMAGGERNVHRIRLRAPWSRAEMPIGNPTEVPLGGAADVAVELPQVNGSVQREDCYEVRIERLFHPPTGVQLGDEIWVCWKAPVNAAVAAWLNERRLQVELLAESSRARVVEPLLANSRLAFQWVERRDGSSAVAKVGDGSSEVVQGIRENLVSEVWLEIHSAN